MTHKLTVDRRAALQQMGLAVVAAGLGPVRLLAGAGSDTELLEAARFEAARGAWPEDAIPNDGRLGPLKDLNGYFPLRPAATAAEWERRADAVRRRILLACGLWPAPDVTPIEAVIHGKVDRDDYTVERVYFQSAPGLYVTGSLYRPKGVTGARPTVICPHGHWANGRFFDHGEATVQKEIESGAEKYPIGGRYPLQARCVQLARMGCVVFHYDMLGYADSVPFTQNVIHGLRDQRTGMTDPSHWGLFSAQAELRLISAMGLQTFNSIRILDWVTTLPDVDKNRIGVTGASGGGTQTFILAAIDSRPAAAFPAVMVSTAMQGGCTCENACYLRIDTGNIEFAALCAPRPLGMSAADDWTVELETKGLPEIKQTYDLLGVPDRVEGKHFKFGHNYNYVSRAMMYAFFNKHLIGHDGPIVEEDFVPLTREELTVWTAEHPKPACDDSSEVAMLKAWDEASERQRLALVPTDKTSWGKYQKVLRGAYDVMIGRDLPAAADVSFEATKKEPMDGYQRIFGVVRNTNLHQELPAAFLLPEKWNGTAVYWLSADGKSSLFLADGSLAPHSEQLVKAGVAVGSADLFETGEFRSKGEPLTETRSVENPRQIASYTLGYNHPLFAQRAHDILTLVVFARNHEWKPKNVYIVGVGDAAWWAAAAGVQCGEAIGKLAVVSDRFRFGSVTGIRDPRMWPGAVKYGDVPGLLSVNAPRPLWIGGEGAQPIALVDACYRAAGAPSAVVMDPGSGKSPDERKAMLERLNRWLLA